MACTTDPAGPSANFGVGHNTQGSNLVLRRLIDMIDDHDLDGRFGADKPEP
jgi:hypothetical protein